MPSTFLQPLDILQRACVHLGVPPIASTTELSKNAVTLVLLYDKIRDRELRRNAWRFATKRVCLRPLASTSVLLTPSAWTSGTNYAGGSMVSSAGTFWINRLENNLGNTPGQPGSGWDPYYGPLSSTPWNIPAPSSISSPSNPFAPPTPGGQYGTTQSNFGYFTGELVHIPKGDGSATFFQALTTAATPADGPLFLDAFDYGTTYAKGQIVSTTLTNPLILGNSGIATPINTGSWLNAGAYQSTVDLNVGNNPDLVVNATAWLVGNSYSLGDVAVGSDNQIYISKVGSNLGNDPFADRFMQINWTPSDNWTGTWTANITPTVRAISNQWQLIPGLASNIVIPYPLTSGPAEVVSTKNAFMLPAGFLREAPPDPKSGGIGYLGVNSRVFDEDWTFESGFIVSASFRPIILRFVADVINVPDMDPMFCDGLAASIAVEAAPTLSPEKLVSARAAYEETMEDARLINAIETGDVQPPVDEYLTCRI